MRDTTLVMLCGLHSAGFAVFHLFFWKLFGWPRSLAGAGTANRAILQIANLCLVYVFSAVALMCLLMPDELLATRPGRAVLGGMAGLWLARTAMQFVYLPYRHPLIHALTVLFLLGTGLFAWPLLR